jgi:putative copper export protein
VARERARAGRHALIIALQFLHVLFAIFWFGSQMYSDLSLKVELAQIDPAARADLSRRTGSGRARYITVVTATGTVVLGILRGIAGGVLAELDTLYGRTWLAALAIGVFMMLSIWTRGYGGRVHGLLWNGLFLVIFALMIAMRFGY